ncbi:MULTISPECIES: signal peptide peptidase SppA [unclassified Aureimonas]|uniref:signal peptide peptidase SppA n=1 Tax=unclassified Aureimonas TaxID=2615206 RepID=UPI0006FF3F1C|nr:MULTISPECIES: signal peptide peptidase SppA [unclassified Aureimonas]KQT64337.1 Clp protease [Aureimonas sp. Leaf427]KQT81526.1 Clp protease [Aureimonas sp. Leaf460]
MTLAQDLIDRRRLRRKLGFWRVAAIVALGALVVGVPLALTSNKRSAPVLGGQIARVEISGIITEDDKLLDLLDDLKDDDAVKAVILKIDSPGGTTVGGETLYRAARAIAEVKPVAAEVGTLAASAGYMVAVASDHIVAHQTSIVGSIGVLFQYVDASVLLGNVGVKVSAIKSSPMKAEPSPFAPAPPEAEAMIRRSVLDTYEWFVALVDERRPFDAAEARRLADGSVFTGGQGLQNRLIDAVGGEAEVRAWLEDTRGVAKDLDIVDREPEKEGGFASSVFGSARAAVFSTLGLDPAAESLPQALTRSVGHLDGLISLWQPPLR